MNQQESKGQCFFQNVKFQLYKENSPITDQQESRGQCFFTNVKFQLYKEKTRIHPDYYRPSETEAQYQFRLRVQRCQQNAKNRQLNREKKFLLPRVDQNVKLKMLTLAAEDKPIQHTSD